MLDPGMDAIVISDDGSDVKELEITIVKYKHPNRPRHLAFDPAITPEPLSAIKDTLTKLVDKVNSGEYKDSH